MALLLKHSDRLDLAPAMSKWMAQSSQSLLTQNMVLIPVPLHRWRLLKRKFNQAAILAQHMAKTNKTTVWVDALTRVKATATQKGMDRAARFANLRGSVVLNENYRGRLKGKTVLLVDDVMTTGATVSACAEVCRQAGAEKVNAVVFARVARPE